MDNSIENLVESYQQSLKVTDKFALRANLRKLEELYKAKVDSQDKDDLFWLHLVKLSVNIRNIELSLYAIAKLKLIQLALLIRRTIQQDGEINQLIALSYISSYFQFENNLKSDLTNLGLSNNSFDEQENLVDYLIDGGSWEEALETIEQMSTYNDLEKSLKKRVIYFRLAQDLEVDENLEEALNYYELSSVSSIHSARVIIKLHLDSSFNELKSHCNNNDVMKKFWEKYSRNYENGQKIDKSLPEPLIGFSSDNSEEKWFNKKETEHLITIGSSLDTRTRVSVAELAARYHKSGNLSKAASLYLCINHLNHLVNIVPNFTSRLTSLKFVSQYSKQNEAIAICLINLYTSAGSKLKKSDSTISKAETLFEAHLKLGLLDESLLELTKESFKNERLIRWAIEYLELVIEEKYSGRLDQIDPEIKSSTLVFVQKTITGNQILSTHVINIVILSISIFIFKLNEATYSYDLSVSKLEFMFKRLTEYLDELNYTASDSLVQSVIYLISAAKEKLDVLTESDTIRNGLAHLVESTAGKCMIEGYYKNAAKLYSQIEDNVNAIKSLMRTGDTDVVIKYSLLVRDVTVTRITMNYLKHIDVDSAIIDDFIAKSKV